MPTLAKTDHTGPASRWSGKLSVCLPAYNEEDCIVDTLDRALAIVPALVAELELIVIDDGSADATAQRVRTVAARDGRVRLVRHERNKGYGAAVTTGLRSATGDLVMFADSDGQFDFVDVAKLLAHLPGNDFVIGYRRHRVEAVKRRLNAWAWGRLVRVMYGVRVRDLDCAFKLFRREVVDRLQLSASGACINAELMCQCRRAGFHFVEVPVEHYMRKGGRATGASLAVIARAFRELPRIQTDPLPDERRASGRTHSSPSPAVVSRRFGSAGAVHGILLHRWDRPKASPSVGNVDPTKTVSQVTQNTSMRRQVSFNYRSLLVAFLILISGGLEACLVVGFATHSLLSATGNGQSHDLSIASKHVVGPTSTAVTGFLAIGVGVWIATKAMFAPLARTSASYPPGGNASSEPGQKRTTRGILRLFCQRPFMRQQNRR